jgi:VanZ family protein
MMHPASPMPSNKWRWIKYWLPVFLYCGIIVYLSSQSYPSRHFPSFLFGLSDKMIHGVEYGILGILLYRAFRQITQPLGSIVLAVICAVGFGITDEIHQWFVPHRHADIWDVVADTAGATFFVCGWVFLTKKYWPFQRIQPHQDH